MRRLQNEDVNTKGLNQSKPTWERHSPSKGLGLTERLNYLRQREREKHCSFLWGGGKGEGKQGHCWEGTEMGEGKEEGEAEEK